jgi:hypothetical protein
MNKRAFLDKLIAMRTLIGFLGEKEQFNWLKRKRDRQSTLDGIVE